MKNTVLTVVTAIVVLTLAVCGIVFTPSVSDVQFKTIKILLIVCACSAAYCFIVGEISRNNSQMDKLWSILPIAYTWIVAGMGGMSVRLVVIAVIVTLWGIRLTFNFARKGAYSIKFWTGEEDYRWVILRQKGLLKNKFVWALFDLFFISIYQNALVLAICLPAVAVMESGALFGALDIVFAILALSFLALETVSDEIQWKFQSTKYKMLNEGKKLEELPAPYDKGFNTVGVWAFSRHPNYLSEQAIWICIYMFTIAAGVVNNVIFNWSIVGCMLLVLLFLGSSGFGESVSSEKYEGYKEYQKQASKYFIIPFKKYKG